MNDDFLVGAINIAATSPIFTVMFFVGGFICITGIGIATLSHDHSPKWHDRALSMIFGGLMMGAPAALTATTSMFDLELTTITMVINDLATVVFPIVGAGLIGFAWWKTSRQFENR